MKLPAYAEGTLSDLLEQRIDLIEDILLGTSEPSEIEELRVYWSTMVEQLDAAAKERSQ